MADKPVAKTVEKTADVAIPAEFKKIIDAIEQMSVLDLNRLVKVFEEKFGVSAVAVAAAPAAGAAGADEKSEYTVELTSVGENKIAVIKAVKEVSGLGLKEAKDLVDGAPGVIKEAVKKEDAEVMKKKIEEAGGKVTLK
ncbi:MAG: 50S ribosomal protein L7/L12 [Candidatus Campbellbacteria bacterium]|nr:50S ribosomal protein L7/L12 [Candidatus Campbellbacteria bacterium]